MSEPLWCDVRQHYCRCHDFGRRCEDWIDNRAQLNEAAAKFMEQMSNDAALQKDSKEK